ncbi:2-oxoacid:ferredoxin oxidoreductase subunit beta [Hydrogenothermus marinus]|uniref:2-oxoglutarate ferredoxin oxidoreductase subunit beta n=1 Tax=Hydrogenothermus marinus TaxID=133270 RepID=A0A3M0BK94_9AQUI|nr:2-oxoacid:ferredoxin oxidoreductase subunit beta [Hydrogenothermus marinus]RMA97641.1 2-oxoglutarate ferredoxin oxidoreductase subunit beta [Hydrogenothermus marinus]
MDIQYVRLEEKLPPREYKSSLESTWCPGCGDFGVVTALTRAFSDEKLDPTALSLVSGIGCSSRLPLWMNAFGLHSCHGRAVPAAVGARLAKPEVPVIVTAGDGDLFSIGMEHFPHAARRNFDMVVISMDNRMYALTKNQVSPTSRTGYKGSLTPYGNLDNPFNVINFAIASGATFVAQTYAGNPKHMTEIIEAAIEHKGFAFVNILSPCPTYNKLDTFKFYKGRLVDINKELGHDPSDKQKAMELAEHDYDADYNPDAKVPIGIFYKTEEIPTFEEKVEALKEKYKPENPETVWDDILSNYKV